MHFKFPLATLQMKTAKLQKKNFRVKEDASLFHPRLVVS